MYQLEAKTEAKNIFQLEVYDYLNQIPASQHKKWRNVV